MDLDEPPLKRSRDTSSSTQSDDVTYSNEFVQRAQNVSVPLPRTPEQPLPAPETPFQPDERQGGGASDHWLQYRTHHIYDSRGRSTSERALERCVQERLFPLHQNRVSTEIGDRLRAELTPRFFAERNYRKSRHHPPAATTLQRTEQRGVLRSAQWRRATELCPPPSRAAVQFISTQPYQFF